MCSRSSRTEYRQKIRRIYLRLVSFRLVCPQTECLTIVVLAILPISKQVQNLREKVNEHLEKEDSFFGDSCYGDFVIKAEDKTFHVSKHQLALESKVFATMFKSGMKEVSEGVLVLDDDPEAVEAMLKYIYMYKKVKGIDLAKKVVQLAHRYEINKLKDQCELEIIDKLTVRGALDALAVAAELQLSLLFSKCNQYLYHYFKDFDTIDSNEMKSIPAAKSNSCRYCGY